MTWTGSEISAGECKLGTWQLPLPRGSELGEGKVNEWETSSCTDNPLRPITLDSHTHPLYSESTSNDTQTPKEDIRVRLRPLFIFPFPSGWVEED